MYLRRGSCQYFSPLQVSEHTADYGTEFVAYGFPADAIAGVGLKPVARLLRGYIQRPMIHRSYLGYTYPAGEMNIAAPGGLSGGPIVTLASTDPRWRSRDSMVGVAFGVVTENARTETSDSSIEREEDGIVRERVISTINYGVCAFLSGEWVRETIRDCKLQ